jgi:hypothetical protein
MAQPELDPKRPAEKARQGEIILKARWQRVLFVAALVGTLLLVVILSLPR